MNLDFKKNEFRLLFEIEYKSLPAKLKKKYQRNIIAKYIHFCNFVKLNSFRIIKNVTGYNIEKLEGYKNRWSARLNAQFRVEFEVFKDLMVIITISNHYE